MVMETQAEKDPTSNRIIENLTTVRLHLKEKNQPVEANSAYSVAMAQAAMECFTRKVGDLSTHDWLSTPPCSINKKVAVCGAFLDPFTYSQLKDICSKVPGFNYDTINEKWYVKMLPKLKKPQQREHVMLNLYVIQAMQQKRKLTYTQNCRFGR
uniref:Uncharacterized protein n=1 Tax=Ditylenchus dipsaci TaxID=166011 RepID=A0A915CP29_9BILA